MFSISKRFPPSMRLAGMIAFHDLALRLEDRLPVRVCGQMRDLSAIGRAILSAHDPFAVDAFLRFHAPQLLAIEQALAQAMVALRDAGDAAGERLFRQMEGFGWTAEEIERRAFEREEDVPGPLDGADLAGIDEEEFFGGREAELRAARSLVGEEL